jgi:hypothetical protein
VALTTRFDPVRASPGLVLPVLQVEGTFRCLRIGKRDYQT